MEVQNVLIGFSFCFVDSELFMFNKYIDCAPTLCTSFIPFVFVWVIELQVTKEDSTCTMTAVNVYGVQFQQSTNQ